MNKKIYSHDIKVTAIGKRNQIWAYSIKDQEIDVHNDGSLISFHQGQELRCSGHWDRNGQVLCYVIECENKELIGEDIVLDSKDFNIYVLVKFEPEGSES